MREKKRKKNAHTFCVCERKIVNQILLEITVQIPLRGTKDHSMDIQHLRGKGHSSKLRSIAIHTYME